MLILNFLLFVKSVAGEPIIERTEGACGGDGMQAWCEEEGQIDAAVANDRACKGHENADEEHACEREEEAEKGEGDGGMDFRF